MILRNGTGRDFVSAITQTPASRFAPLLFSTTPPILFLSTCTPEAPAPRAAPLCWLAAGRAITQSTTRRAHNIVRVTLRISVLLIDYLRFGICLSRPCTPLPDLYNGLDAAGNRLVT